MKARKLQPGDEVAVISPSSSIINNRKLAEIAKLNFERATGLTLHFAPNAFASHYYSAGTPQQRLEDFRWALNEPNIKAIIFSVGGKTAVELIDGLDYELIRQHPKIIAGVSDATTLLNSISAKTGLITFLGLEFLDYGKQPMAYETAAIKQAWFEGTIDRIEPNPHWRDFDDLPTSYKGWQSIKPGVATGRIVGGNFPSFAQLIKTDYMPDLTDSILVMETYKWDKSQIHQALVQLKLWGTYEKISGLIIGYCLGSDDPTRPGYERMLPDIAREITASYSFPIMWLGEIGHNVENIMLPIGAQARIDTHKNIFEITEAVTE